MIISGTVISISNESTDTVDVTIAVTQPYPGQATLSIPEDVGAGYLPDEWNGTFSVGTEVQFGVEQDESGSKVTGFRVGSYQRGFLL